MKYVPVEDGPALTWMQTFSNLLTTQSAVYGVTSADAANVANAVSAYASAFAIASAPATRTSGSISFKDECRNNAEQLCRQFAIDIKYNAGISDQAKIDIGVRPVNPNREPIYVPATSPILSIIGVTPGSQTLRFADTETPAKRKKPYGALQLQLFVAVGTAPTQNEGEAQFYGAFTTNPIGVGFSDADDGKVATYFARWAGRRGDVGPWSVPISMRIAA